MTGDLSPRLGLALSGGGARGLAHIGVLSVLETEGITPSLLAGTSMGGLVASAAAAGYGAEWMRREALYLSDWRRLAGLIDLGFLMPSIVAGRRIRSYLQQKVGQITFAELKKPLTLVAVDLVSGDEVWLRSGTLVEAIMATIAFPGVFPPVRLGSRYLVDGGVLNNLPVDAAREMGADVVVAVDASPETAALAEDEPGEGEAIASSILEALKRAAFISQFHLTERRLRETRPDVLIRPDLGPDISIFGSFSHAKAIIEKGGEAAERALPEIKRCLSTASAG